MDRSQRRRRVEPSGLRLLSGEFSQDASFLETEVGQSSLSRRTDNYVIEQLDLQKLRGFSQTSREAMIGLAGGGITGRMVVHHDHCISGRNHRGTEHITWMCDALVYAPDGDFLHLEETVACIEKDDAQGFLVEGPHFSG